MKRIVRFPRSVVRDAPIIGYGPYLSYRLRSFRKDKSPMTVTVAGQKVQVRPGTPDLRVAFQSLRHEFDILRDILPRDFDGIIVDAGGHIGAAAMKLSAMYPRAAVVTIEPSDANFAMLQGNTRDYPNIHPVKAALATDSGRDIALLDRGTGEWGFSIAVQDSATAKGTVGTVSTVTLEDILARFPGKQIGLIKMDIEGGAYALFTEPSNAWRAIPAIFVDLHDRIVAGCADAFARFSPERRMINAGGKKHLSLAGCP